ncbi:MAG: hypothetical protein ACRCT8_05070 [Lacipirellulaceae bacterium]
MVKLPQILGAIAISALCAGRTPVRAAIIIDDFTTPQSIELPRDEGEFNTVALNGGMSGRSVFPVVGVYNTHLVAGSLRTNLDGRGLMAGRIDRYPVLPRNPGDLLGGLLNFNVDYGFVDPATDTPRTVDLSQEGVNDTVYIDFRVLRARQELSAVGIELSDGEDTYRSDIFAPLRSETPFTLSFPVASLAPWRGGVANGATLQSVRYIGFDVDVAGLFGPVVEDLGLYFEIDRFWVGSAIPEPASGVLALVGGVCLASRRRGRAHAAASRRR